MLRAVAFAVWGSWNGMVARDAEVHTANLEILEHLPTRDTSIGRGAQLTRTVPMYGVYTRVQYSCTMYVR